MQENFALAYGSMEGAAVLAQSPRDRRMSIRWRPRHPTFAELEGEHMHWTGDVLNLSQDGVEVTGCPPERYNPNAELLLRICFSDYSVQWSGRLLRTHSRANKRSHVVVFRGSSAIPEEKGCCAVCEEIIVVVGGDSTRSLHPLLCVRCSVAIEQEIQEVHLG